MLRGASDSKKPDVAPRIIHTIAIYRKTPCPAWSVEEYSTAKLEWKFCRIVLVEHCSLMGELLAKGTIFHGFFFIVVCLFVFEVLLHI